MQPVHVFSASADFPAPFDRFGDLLGNLAWSWDLETVELFASIDPVLWERVNHSPWRLLGAVRRERLEELASNEEFVARFDAALDRLDAYLDSPGWYSQHYGSEEQETIAYFSAEFGLHESIPLYSGGLGVLSGDHTKSASDLGLPFVGVGLLYQMGYFRQRLTADGSQVESYERNDPSYLPISRIRDREGREVTVSIPVDGEDLVIGLWQMSVGRVRLVLLDTDRDENHVPHLRNITGYLYGGDKQMRILQEIVLGIGGLRALESIGIRPDIIHCNEGHSAFGLIERTAHLANEHGISFDEAHLLTAAGAVFTTHTPVPAGHDVFDGTLVARFLGDYLRTIGIEVEEFLRFGRVDPNDRSEGLSMTVLALRFSGRRNGVSQLHGEVSRKMWRDIWPLVPESETPIVGLTNGIHAPTFIAPEIDELYRKYIGQDWRVRLDGSDVWKGVDEIPDDELAAARRRMKSAMIERLRRRLVDRRSEIYSRSEIGRKIDEVLDPEALTIGFARRFATYKRATLLLRDRDRARRLFADSERPLQLVLAGKAHPKDEAGKEFIADIIRFAREEGFEDRILFIDDYDIGVARSIVQGCDIWLNTPRRPMEASGTSGMKAALNGTINLSILDGWFPEAYDGSNGWAIGDTRAFIDAVYQDEIESRALYDLLEQEVIPSYYEAGSAPGESTTFLDRRRSTMRTMAAPFSSDRMVGDYVRMLYRPAIERFRRLDAEGGSGTRNLSAWIEHLRSIWSDIAFEQVTMSPERTEVRRGESIDIDAGLDLGRVAPENVRVQAMVGPIDADGEIADGRVVPLEQTGSNGSQTTYAGTVVVDSTGRQGITLRVLPADTGLIDPIDVGLVTWR